MLILNTVGLQIRQNKLLWGLFLLLMFAACTTKQEKPSASSPLWEEKEEGLYDLHEIQASGTIIAGTLSGPDTYYEYHGKGPGGEGSRSHPLADPLDNAAPGESRIRLPEHVRL